MVNAIGAALSGLRAASRRIEVSSANLANQFSTKTRVDGVLTNEPYRAQVVDQVSIKEGGVQTLVRDANPAVVPLFNPADPAADARGIVNMPNVDTANEAINIKIASNSYRANLSTLKVQDEMEQSLLDILS